MKENLRRYGELGRRASCPEGDDPGARLPADECEFKG